MKNITYVTDLGTAGTAQEAAGSRSNPGRGDTSVPGAVEGVPAPELEDARLETERKWMSG